MGKWAALIPRGRRAGYAILAAIVASGIAITTFLIIGEIFQTSGKLQRNTEVTAEFLDLSSLLRLTMDNPENCRIVLNGSLLDGSNRPVSSLPNIRIEHRRNDSVIRTGDSFGKLRISELKLMNIRRLGTSDNYTAEVFVQAMKPPNTTGARVLSKSFPVAIRWSIDAGFLSCSTTSDVLDLVFNGLQTCVRRGVCPNARICEIGCGPGEKLMSCSGSRNRSAIDTCDENDCGYVGSIPIRMGLSSEYNGCRVGIDNDIGTVPVVHAYCLSAGPCNSAEGIDDTAPTVSIGLVQKNGAARDSNKIKMTVVAEDLGDPNSGIARIWMAVTPLYYYRPPGEEGVFYRGREVQLAITSYSSPATLRRSANYTFNALGGTLNDGIYIFDASGDRIFLAKYDRLELVAFAEDPGTLQSNGTRAPSNMGWSVKICGKGSADQNLQDVINGLANNTAFTENPPDPIPAETLWCRTM